MTNDFRCKALVAYILQVGNIFTVVEDSSANQDFISDAVNGHIDGGVYK